RRSPRREASTPANRTRASLGLLPPTRQSLLRLRISARSCVNLGKHGIGRIKRFATHSRSWVQIGKQPCQSCWRFCKLEVTRLFGTRRLPSNNWDPTREKRCPASLSYCGQTQTDSLN